MNLSAAVDTIGLDLIAIRNPNRGGAMAEITADVCAVPDVPFEKAREAYADRKFWVSFFIRPCCPPPGGKTAAKHLEEQREMVRARADFSGAGCRKQQTACTGRGKTCADSAGNP